MGEYVMVLYIRELDYHKDADELASFALEGMNFSRYTKLRFAQKLYSRYFVREGILNATLSLGAYTEEGQLTGALLARFNGEQPVYRNFFWRCYVWLFELVLSLFFGSHTDEYDTNNRKMLQDVTQSKTFDGELSLFAVDPKQKGQGVGTALLSAFQTRKSGKQIYLFTDSNCTYQFYQHRGFEQASSVDIHEPGQSTDQKLSCFVFTRTL